MQIIISISQNAVLQEVAQTAEYAGDKKTDDTAAYERIRIVDENKPELLRFWDESRAELALSMQEFLTWEGMRPDAEGHVPTEELTKPSDTYFLVLEVADLFNDSLMPGMTKALFSYFVSVMVGNWYNYTNRTDAEVVFKESSVLLQELKSMTWKRRRPSRPTVKDNIIGSAVIGSAVLD